MKLFIHSLIIILSTSIVFVIVNTPAAVATPYIIGFLILTSLIYILFRKMVKKNQEMLNGSNKEIFVIIVFLLLIIFISGGIGSPVFFLTYFLLFGITFIYEPAIIIFFLLCLAGLFIPGALENDVFSNFFKLASLFLLAPIAFFFGREYTKRENLEKRVEKTTETIIEDAKEIAESKDKAERLRIAKEIIDEAKKLNKD